MSNDQSDPAEKPEGSLTRLFARRLLVCFLVSMLAGQGALSAMGQQAGPVAQPEPTSSAQQPQQNSLPDSPAPAGADRQGNDQNQASEPAQQSGENPKAVGTAAAPYVKPTGVAAARPAGAAIAPAKQRRAHSFVIKFALIAGAAAAGGAVVALSMGSRSRPQ
jgi:hypothetical protein